MAFFDFMLTDLLTRCFILLTDFLYLLTDTHIHMIKSAITFKIIRYFILLLQWGFLGCSVFAFYRYYTWYQMMDAALGFLFLGYSYQCHQLTAALLRNIVEDIRYMYERHREVRRQRVARSKILSRFYHRNYNNTKHK